MKRNTIRMLRRVTLESALISRFTRTQPPLRTVSRLYLVLFVSAINQKLKERGYALRKENGADNETEEDRAASLSRVFRYETISHHVELHRVVAPARSGAPKVRALFSIERSMISGFPSTLPLSRNNGDTIPRVSHQMIISIHVL